MRRMIWLLAVLPLVAPAQAPEPTLRTTTSEVLLDFVARDKNARIVHDLRADEVQIFEDGVPQKMKHFEFVDGRSEAAEAPPADLSGTKTAKAPATVNELRDISVVSVVIASLDPRGRKLTTDAMRDFVKNELKPNVFVGVFSLGMSGLRTLQFYTNNGDKISAAVEKAANSAMTDQLSSIGQQMLPDYALGSASGRFASVDYPTNFSDTSGDTTDGGSDFGANGGPVLPTTSGGSAAAGAAAAAVGNSMGPGLKIAQLMSARWQQELHDVYTDSMRYLAPLYQLAQSQANIPGRKVILLFSAGLPVQYGTVEQLNNVISTANRSNVTIYAVDTRGLSEVSDTDNSRRLLQAAAYASMKQQLAGSKGGDQTVRPDSVVSGEIAESALHADTRGNLAQLAEGTGGSLLPSSLDMREPLSRALEDVRTHYDVTYSPANLSLDGKFRTIEVKVTRPGVRVFARSGYYALPVLNGEQIYPFEMATLKAINTKPDLHQFDFRATTMHFRTGATKTQMAYVFQTPIRDLTVTQDKQWAEVHVCVTALVKDDQGQVVDKISKDIPYQMPVEKRDEFERGLVSFTAPFLLPAGHYTIETAAVDRQSMKASVSRSELNVGPYTGFTMSDVTVARSVAAIQGPVNGADPFEAHGGKVTPDVSDTLAPDSNGSLKFYAVAYPPPPADSPVAMNIEIWRQDKLLMRSPAQTVFADPTGAVSILAALPTAKFPPGEYQARISFQYKGEKLTRKVEFKLVSGS